MKRSFLKRAALMLALVAGVAGSALSSATENDFGKDYEQVFDNFEINALIFKPKHHDAMGAVLKGMHLTPLADDGNGNVQYALDAAGKTDVLSMLQKYGELEIQLHRRGPLGNDGRAGAFSMSPEKKFSASLKARYIPSVKHLPPAFIMDYSLKASLNILIPTSNGAGLPRYACSGSVLLPVKGALMSVNKTANGFLIWIISAY